MNPLSGKVGQNMLKVRINANAVSGRTNELAAEYRLRTVSLSFPCFDKCPPLCHFSTPPEFHCRRDSNAPIL